ncbi:hypothetical protein BC831DRAFT_405857 [Entophlyctis helioformis]|nr:hypothetical protein BC831DRAFT_405857 [Entophlyctis helioformis]
MAALAAVSSVEAAALSSLSKPVQLPAKAPLPSPSPFTPPAAAGSGTRSDRICAVCDQPIVRGGAGLRGKFYHTEHFVCSDPTCKRALRGQVTFEKNDQLFCEKCYHNNFSPKCAYCREPIKDNIIEALGLTFHRAHFFCSQCGRTFGPDDMFREFEGKAYCEDDYAALFADRCAACHQPMLDNSVSALDRQWHSTCFVCADPACNTMLTAEGFYEYQGRPYCELHYYHQTDNICDVCKKPIIGRCVVALDRKFHPRHFTCSFCQTELDGSAGQGYKERSGKPYCGNCYIKLFC